MANRVIICALFTVLLILQLHAQSSTNSTPVATSPTSPSVSNAKTPTSTSVNLTTPSVNSQVGPTAANKTNASGPLTNSTLITTSGLIATKDNSSVTNFNTTSQNNGTESGSNVVLPSMITFTVAAIFSRW